MCIQRKKNHFSSPRMKLIFIFWNDKLNVLSLSFSKTPVLSVSVFLGFVLSGLRRCCLSLSAHCDCQLVKVLGTQGDWWLSVFHHLFKCFNPSRFSIFYHFIIVVINNMCAYALIVHIKNSLTWEFYFLFHSHKTSGCTVKLTGFKGDSSPTILETWRMHVPLWASNSMHKPGYQ